MNEAGKISPSGCPSALPRAVANITSICAFQDSMQSSRSTASTPTLMDSTMFSLNSFSRSYSCAFCSSEAYRRAFWMAMPTVPARVSSRSTSSLERKSPSTVFPRPSTAMMRPRTVQGM